MKRSRFWLVLTAVLFAVWIGYLAYLVVGLLRQPKEVVAFGNEKKAVPVVLSRPQFLISSLVVTVEAIAKDGKPTEVKVAELHWPDNPELKKLVSQSIEIKNLPGSIGFAGPGTYIIPLVRVSGEYQVAPTPPSPGYPPGNQQRPGNPGPPHVYRDSPAAREQLERIRSDFQKQ